ncbi:hypothetical protein [Lacticaseibacillus absianus]|uniref:hypothetical protein n=1 Tax=Lacticaseibacillus absianus TaxID=2729623 RepID=UPI0015CEB80F|nr:hypothetical protein [Lacticaseibacillus absianus]
MGRRASALMGAVLLLSVVTVIGLATLQRFALWRSEYQARLRLERTALDAAVVQWQALGPSGDEQAGEAVLPGQNVPRP